MRGVALLTILVAVASLAGCIHAPGAPDAPTGQVDGAVVDQWLQPFGNVTVVLAPLGLVDTTSPLGGFTFRGVPPGDYTVISQPPGTQATSEPVTVRPDEVARTILQTARPETLGPYKAALGNRGAAEVLLPGEACSQCAWTARLGQMPEEMVLRVEWESGVDRAVRVVVQDSAGRIVRDITEQGSIWSAIAGTELDPHALSFDVSVSCADDVLPCTDFHADSFLDVYYGADRDALE